MGDKIVKDENKIARLFADFEVDGECCKLREGF